MGLDKKEKWLTFSWVFLFLVIIIFLFYGTHAAAKQNKVYQNDYQMLQYIKKQLSNGGKPTQQVATMLTGLYQKYPGDYQLTWYMGELEALQGDLDHATNYYQTALNTRPALLTESLFAFQYGELEYMLKNYDHSTQLLTISLNDQGSDQYKTKINKLLTAMQQVTKK